MNQFACPDCGGSGVAECRECGRDVDCDVCDGSGLDPDKIDLAAWLAADDAFIRRHGTSWAWIVRGEWLGRMSPSGEALSYRRFALDESLRLPPHDPRQMTIFAQEAAR
jgi:hypothetical protein